MSFINLNRFGIDFTVNTQNIVAISPIKELKEADVVTYGVSIFTNAQVIMKDDKVVPLVISFQDKEKEKVIDFINFLTEGVKK